MAVQLHASWGALDASLLRSLGSPFCGSAAWAHAQWRCRIAGAHVLPALACAEQVAEPVVLQAFPFPSRAFGALMKALWWHGVAHTLDSFTHVLGQMLSYGVRMRRAAAGEPPLRENTLDLCDPRYVWKDLYSSFLALIRRHLDFGPNRVEPVSGGLRVMRAGRWVRNSRDTASAVHVVCVGTR